MKLADVNQHVERYLNQLNAIKNDVEAMKVDIPDEAENKLSLQGWNEQIGGIIGKINKLISEVEEMKVTDEAVSGNPVLKMLFDMF